MDYNREYKKCKDKYETLHKQKGGRNICNLPKNAKLTFGSGGSRAIIAILKNRAYKYFPLFVYDSDYEMAKRMLRYFKFEIYVNKILTTNILNKNLSPHIIKYYGHTKCNEKPTKMFKDCPGFTEYLMSKKRINPTCGLIINKGYPNKLSKPMYVLDMERADDSLSNYIRTIAKEKWDIIEDFLDCLFFQVFFTIEQIKSVYPNYSHNDMFIRNILVRNKNHKENTYIRYHYKNKTFDVPANNVFIKISDFGITQISNSFHRKHKIPNKVIKDKYRDYFSILYDVYNGANLGSTSLYNLIKRKKTLKKIDSYFNRYFSVSTIKKIIKNNKKGHLDWNWGKTVDKKFIKAIKMKDIDTYLSRYSKIYPYDKKHDIVEEYGK